MFRKAIHVAAILGALAVGSAQADEILSGVQNPGAFAPVPQGVSQWQRNPSASGFSGLTNPGNFAPVIASQPAASDALETSNRRAYDEILSGVANPVRSAEAKKGYGARLDSGTSARN
jgi:hypothetical protein